MSKAKKEFTLEELDEATLSAEYRGRAFGLMDAHQSFYNGTTDIKQGLETMQLILEQSNQSGANDAEILQLQFAIDTVTLLEGRFQTKYENMLADCTEEDIDDAYWALKDF